MPKVGMSPMLNAGINTSTTAINTMSMVKLVITTRTFVRIQRRFVASVVVGASVTNLPALGSSLSCGPQ